MVDLHRRRRLADRVRRLFSDIQVDRCANECWNTLPIPWMPNQEAYQLRYVFGYAMDGSDLPCYMLWPTRTVEQSFWCIDAWKGDWVRLDKCSFIAPVGIEHFFDAFCLHPQRPWRAAACHALSIPSCHVAEDTHLEHLPVNKFSLTPRRIPVERKASADKSRVDLAMVASEESGSEAESGWSGVSDNSSTDSECTNLEASSVASDQDRFETAYDAFRNLAEGLYDIDLTQYSRGVTSEDASGVQLQNGQEKLQELVHLPRTWPLAILTIPLAGLSKQIDRLLEGYCFQILATNRDPEPHNEKVIQTATHLTWILAEYLADTIAWLMRSILDHASKILFDNDTQPLLTPSFWILPLYRELLNSARRIRPSASSERARGCTGLVKIICKENKEQRGKRKYHAGTPHPNDRGGFTQWFGSCSLMSTLYIWFPASWAPMVAERLFGWSSHPRVSPYSQCGQPASGPPQTYSGAHPWHQNSHDTAGSSVAMEDADSTEVVYKSGNGHCLVLLLCRCSTLAVESSGLNWMIKLSWTAIRCYRRAFSVMCFCKNAQQRGRALVEKGLRLPSCCRAVKMRMTGSTSCCRKRTSGLLLQPGVLSLKRSPHRSLVESGAGYRPSICGWRSSCVGECWLTGCTPGLPLGSPKKNLMPCFLTGQPRETTRIRMKKNHIGVLQSKKSKHGGNNAKSGWHTSKDKLRHWSSTSRVF